MEKSIREILEEREHKELSEYASFSDETKGRARKEELCDVRTEFQRDRDRILHSKSFRRLKDKTQVFLTPNGDHYRTRLTHTLEVSQNARTIAKALDLNEDLAEAVAMGHDLGHTPFGHAGEAALSDMMGKPFRHNEQSLRVVDYLEKDGAGLNLTYEVLNGMACHTGDALPTTFEGQVVRLSDRIAYINHEIDDACRAGILQITDVPAHLREALGETHSARINTMVNSLIRCSEGKDDIAMEPEIYEATMKLREFLYDSVYLNPAAKSQEVKARALLIRLFEHYVKNPDKLPTLYQSNIEKDGVERCVCDFLSGMTDRYAIETYNELYIPRVWRGPTQGG